MHYAVAVCLVAGHKFVFVLFSQTTAIVCESVSQSVYLSVCPSTR